MKKIIEENMNNNKFKYMLLGRLESDCKYFLGAGGRYEKALWSGSIQDHIEDMTALYNSFSDDKKPEWITLEKIKEYEKQMNDDEHIIRIYLNDSNGKYSEYYTKFVTDTKTATDIKNAFINNDLNALKEILDNAGKLPFYDEVAASEYLTLEIDINNYDEVIQGN
jgi:hypothetical protein